MVVDAGGGVAVCDPVHVVVIAHAAVTAAMNVAVVDPRRIPAKAYAGRGSFTSQTPREEPVIEPLAGCEVGGGRRQERAEGEPLLELDLAKLMKSSP